MAKIAIVLNAAWNVYNFRLPLLHRLRRAGHEIIVIAPDDAYREKIPYPFYHIPIRSQSLNPVDNLWVLVHFLRIFKKTHPDIALLYTIKPNIYGNFAAYLLGVKTISNIAGLGALFIRPGLATKTAKWLYKRALKIPEKVFFQNTEDMVFFTREGLAPKRICEKIPGSGVDIHRFRPMPRKGEKNGKFIFLLMTRMLWDKGVREFVDAARRVLQKRKDVEFHLLGFVEVDNPQAVSKKEMADLTAMEGIVYLGVSDHVEEVIRNADCVVLPSYREGLPRCLLEAAAMEKPIITTDVSGCRDVVDDGVNGFLCQPRDSLSLLSAMEKMLALDGETRTQMGEAGRKKIVSEFDQEIVIEKYVKAVNSILTRL